MARDIDQLLKAMREAPLEVGLDGIEDGVWRRVEAHRRQAQSPGVAVQLAAVVGALALGLAVGGHYAERPRLASEVVVLSEDAIFAPSVVVEGGA